MYIFVSLQQTSAKSWRDVFTGAGPIHLPDLSAEKRGHGRLRNELLTYLKTQKCGWTIDGVSNVGKQFVSTVSDTLWYLDGHYSTISAVPGCKIPEVVLNRFQGFNRPEEHRHVEKRIDAQLLCNHAENLILIVSKPYMQRKEWESVKIWLSELVEAMKGYANYLNRKNQVSKDRHSSTQPMSTPSENTSITPLKVNPSLILTPSQVSDLKPIISALEKSQEFEAIDVTDMLPEDRFKRYRLVSFIREKRFSGFAACMFCYAPGGSVPNIYFIWKEPSESIELETERAHIQGRLMAEMPVFHTRQMRKEFQAKADLICNLSPAQVRNIYKELTGDESVSENTVSKEMDTRMRAVMLHADPDVIIDMRTNGKGRPPKYDDFWDIVQEQIELKIDQAVDDRRHAETTVSGEVITHRAVAASSAALYRDCCQIAQERGISSPTYTWFLFQFWPKDPSLKTALQYTGRFHLKNVV